MTLFEKMSVFGSVLTILLGIIGFYFIVKQIKLLNTTVKSSTNSNLYSLTIDINKFLIENPELRPFFYGDANGHPVKYDPTHPQFHRIETLADIYVTFWEFIFQEKDQLGHDLFTTWLNWMKEMHKVSPALQRHLAMKSKWYSEDFINTISE